MVYMGRLRLKHNGLWVGPMWVAPRLLHSDKVRLSQAVGMLAYCRFAILCAQSLPLWFNGTG
jgi:hypothetical protein